jgi:hypothetical protein
MKSESLCTHCGDTGQRSWLRHYATNPKVVVSIPDEVIEFLN